MRLHKALEYELPIKRSFWDSFADPADRVYSYADQLANDWEVNEPSISITKSQALDALVLALTEEMAATNRMYIGDISNELREGAIRRFIEHFWSAKGKADEQ